MKSINQMAFEYAYTDTSDLKILKIDRIISKL
jgi:hypothetical protein